MNIWQALGEALGSLTRSGWGWLQPKAGLVGDLGDYVFFRYVLQRLEHDIEALGSTLLGNVMQFVSFLALIVVTLWILLQGYKVVTGQMRESMMSMFANMTRTVFIVAVALSFGVTNDRITTFLTHDMKDGIHHLVTGDDGSPEDAIDANLGWLQVALSSMDLLESGGDLDGAQEKERAQTLIQLGTGGPPIVAGTLLLMYQVAMALFIGLGPFFILCLLFDSTKNLFHKWLMYGIGTMFSMALLSAMVSIALAMVSDLARALWAADALTTLFLPGAEGVTGFSSRAMQSGAMGLILSMLLITVPPLAANFFGGTIGQFSPYVAFGAGAAATQAERGGYPPGTGPVYQPMQPGGDAGRLGGSKDNAGDFRTAQSAPYQSAPAGGQPISDTVKPHSPLRDQTGPDPNAGRYTATDSPPAQPAGPTTQPPPPPRDPTPRRGGA